MINYDLARARLAVQLLVDSPYFHNFVKKLRNYITKPRALPFSGDLEPLNELIVVGRQSATAMENLIAVAEHKRDDRNDYQRQYMAAKRKRDRKVIALEELMTGKILDQDERMSVLHRQYAAWNQEKDAHLARFPGIAWGERNDKIREFWALKEAEIDTLTAQAKERGPVHRKRIVNTAPVADTDFGQALRAAVGKGKQKR